MQTSGFLWFSSIDWGFLWQGHQELALRFAQDGHSVLYVDTLGMRQPTSRDLGRIGRRLINRLKGGITGVRYVQSNLAVYSPVTIPLSDPLVDSFNRHLVLWSIEHWLREHTVRPRIVWAILPHPYILDLMSRVEIDLVVYYCVNPVLENVAGASTAVVQTERRLLQVADVIFAESPSLMRERSAPNRTIYPLLFGVHPDRFSISEHSPVSEELAAVPRPRIGFFGTIGPWLDLDLIHCMAQARPEWSIVMLGPIRTDVSLLRGRNNIHFIGARSHRKLPTYLAGFDVLMMPYQLNAFTTRIFPGKTYECLATGKPVVATDLPDLRPLGELIYLSADREAFLSNVAHGLAESDELAQRRRACARANSWGARYRFALEKLEEHLRQKGGDGYDGSRS